MTSTEMLRSESVGSARYHEIADNLRQRIRDGEWGPGDTLPRHVDLAEEFGVSRNVVARAVGALEGEPPFQVSSTWIHPRGVEAAPEVREPYGTGPGAWLDRLEEAGHGPIEWLERRRARMPEREEAALLQIPVSLPVWEIVRIGYSGGDENAIEVTQVVIPSDRMEEVSRLQRDESAQWPHHGDGPDGPPVVDGLSLDQSEAGRAGRWECLRIRPICRRRQWARPGR